MDHIRQTVVTIHGVNPDRGWQRMAGRVLEPHFRPVPIEYDEYLGLKGPIKAVFSLWLAPFVAAGFALAVFMAVRGHWALALAGVGGAVGSFGVGLWVAYKQRQACVDRVKPRLIAATAGDPMEPHVIAHSFGTYLIGTALRKFPDVMVGRVVFFGSVLPRHYDWEKVLAEKSVPFTVRNETGKRDCVVKLVGLVKCVARDMGDAGLKGFAASDGVVHDQGTVWGACEECAETSDVVPVHNVPLQEFAHSTPVLGPGHAQSLWLPYLWGYTPEEFFWYLRLCRGAAYLRQEHRWGELRRVVRRLHVSVWTWTKPYSLATYVRRTVEYYLRDGRRAALVRRSDRNMREIIEEAIELMYLAVI
jgi:pimeloyl-ACP methyl ester carboxylesterase